jgi:hypothetical protein
MVVCEIGENLQINLLDTNTFFAKHYHNDCHAMLSLSLLLNIPMSFHFGLSKLER